jgi:hypothetical protein
LLVYVTSKRDGVNASMATDALPYLIDQLDTLAAGTTELDFLIVSFGGDPMVAWRIMSLIRERGIDRVSVLIPQSAYSAATLVALGADEIVMHPNGHLGPIDMQITTFFEGRPKNFSTEDISAFLEFVRENLGITDQKHLRALFELTCREVGSTGVGFVARNSRLAVALAERLLEMHKVDEDGVKNKARVESLSRQFHSHSYPVSRKEAMQIGLDVNPDRDPTLEALMWDLWLDLEEELKERHPFSPIMELLNSAQSSKLLESVSQLTLPCNAPQPTNFQSNMTEVQGAATRVEAIDYEQICGVIESCRLANRSTTKGRILACRMPDLKIQFNVLVSFRGWEKTHSKGVKK